MTETGEFILTLLHGATNLHIHHLRSKSFSEHMALGEAYEALPGLVDTVAEAIQGLTGELLEFPKDYYAPADTALQEVEDLLTFVKDERKEIPQDSEIQNAVDAIAELLDSTRYKLKFLK